MFAPKILKLKNIAKSARLTVTDIKYFNDVKYCKKFNDDLKKQRKYPYDYELEQKYREFQSNPSKLYKDDEIENALTSLEKMNQIQTLDHGEITTQANLQQGGGGGGRHGRRRTLDNRMKSREFGRGAGGLSGSVSVDDLDRPRINGKIGGGEGLLQKAPTRNSTDTTPIVKSRKSRKERKTEISEDSTDDEGDDQPAPPYSDKDSDSIKDLSFTLPKPLNLKQQKIESITTDCDMETSLALAPRSSMDSSALLRAKDQTQTKNNEKPTKTRELYAMEGYV